MNDVVIATTPADADAVEAVRSHHAEMAGALTTHVAAVVGAVRAGHDAVPARDVLLRWCGSDLLPHARAEEEVLYPAGQALPRTRILVEAMIAEHDVLAGLVDRLRRAGDPVQVVGAATALQVLFDSHVAKENDQLLPALAEAPEISVGDLLEGMHHALAEEAHDADRPAEGSGHSCTCGEHEPAGDPELDARVVPHAIRHATVFGALDAVRPGAGMVLIAPHDPLPLLAQIEQREPGAFDISYLERGPEAWRLRFARRSN